MVNVNHPYTILGIGNPFLDSFAFVDDAFLEQQGLVKGDTFLTTDRKLVDKIWEAAPKKESHAQGKLGGSCANVIKVLSTLGHKCALCGMIGKDDIGKILLEKLNGIGVVPLITQGSNGSGMVNCFVTPDCQRTMQTYLGSTTEFSEKNIEPKYFDGIAHVHLEAYVAYYGNTLEKCLQMAQKTKVPISLDLASPDIIKQHRPIVSTCASEVDILFGNLSEYFALTYTESPEEAVKHFRKDQTIVITAGANGCWVKAAGDSHAVHFKALPVEKVVDTTGAGDFFDAGYLHGLFSGKSISESVSMGNLAARYVIQQLGTETRDSNMNFIFF